MGYALFKDGQQVSKVHSTRRGAGMEAYEAGAVVIMSLDFREGMPERALAGGYEIRSVDEAKL